MLDARRELVFERRYRWDRTDQIVQQIHTDATPATPGEKYSQYLWGYDAAGQVTKAVEPQKEERFFWDPAGNRTEEHRKAACTTTCSATTTRSPGVIRRWTRLG